MVSRDVRVSVVTLERWREDAQSRLEAVITTAALDETGKLRGLAS